MLAELLRRPGELAALPDVVAAKLTRIIGLADDAIAVRLRLSDTLHELHDERRDAESRLQRMLDALERYPDGRRFIAADRAERAQMARDEPPARTRVVVCEGDPKERRWAEREALRRELAEEPPAEPPAAPPRTVVTGGYPDLTAAERRLAIVTDEIEAALVRMQGAQAKAAAAIRLRDACLEWLRRTAPTAFAGIYAAVQREAKAIPAPPRDAGEAIAELKIVRADIEAVAGERTRLHRLPVTPDEALTRAISKLDESDWAPEVSAFFGEDFDPSATSGTWLLPEGGEHALRPALVVLLRRTLEAKIKEAVHRQAEKYPETITSADRSRSLAQVAKSERILAFREELLVRTLEAADVDVVRREAAPADIVLFLANSGEDAAAA